MARPFAVFDVDGTLIRWQLYHAIGDGMAKRGIIDSSEFDRVRRARMNWKRRTGQESFNDYEQALIKAFDTAITGLEISVFKEVVGKVFDEYKEQVYTYTRDLIEMLRKENYLLFAVSGSPQMIVSLLAKYYDFDDFAGTDYKTLNGLFTGEKIISLGHKGELLNQLIKKHSASLKGSIAVGDTESDLDMLNISEKAIAFNPTQQLFEQARLANWPVVIERKNVVYKLDPSDGNYALAR